MAITSSPSMFCSAAPPGWMTCRWLACLRGGFFEKGLLVLSAVQQRLQALGDRAAQRRAIAEGIMKSLDWPKLQHSMPSQRPPTTSPEASGGGVRLTTLGAATCSDNELHVAHERLAIRVT